jgi:very-short-patch-repair endonuclease
VIDRRVKGNGCPKCSGRDVTPTTSLRILYPQLAAEWHPTKNGNLTPDDVKPGSNQKVWWLCPLDPSHEWLAQVAKRVKGNGCQRCRGQIATPTTSLQALYPDLAAEWHPTKNSDLLPDQVRPGSGKKVWWCCTNNHEWQAAIYSRASGNGCQICSGRVATIMTSLRVLYPELAAEWHSEKNRALTPEDVLPGSSRRVWWRCLINPDHEWSATIITRTKHHTGCPLCASLSTLYPQLSVEWHPEKNKDLTPDQVTPGSNRKVWWRCLHDHEWVASIYQRVKGSGCGFCEGRIVTSTNSLYAVYPHLAMEWHLTKNETLTPYDVLPGSGRKVWWQCLKGHEWDATIVMRKEGTGCPSCSGRVATPDTSLQALRPDLAMEWHPTKNGTVTPDQVKPGTDKKVWWQCQKDLSHEWEALIYNRTAGYGGCPHCREMSGSALEDFFAHLLDTEHILYERQKSIGPWHVDFYLPEHAVILEVQGCYWHGCLQCGYDTEMHRDKRRRDSQRKRYLHWKKYQIEEIWEHELHQNAEAILARIKEKYQAKDK